MRLVGPGWRLLGAALSWWLFVLCVTLLLDGASTVVGLGGFCASGGPYEIEVECPAEVVATVPLSIFGGFGAAAIALVLARGFGAPLLAWAWPILFTGLGVAFAVAAATVEGGVVTNLLLAAMFLAFGLVPFVLSLRTAPRVLFLGWTRADDRPFTIDEDRIRTPVVRLPASTMPLSASGDPVAPRAVDWVLGLGLPLAAAALGYATAAALLDAIVAGGAAP